MSKAWDKTNVGALTDVVTKGTTPTSIGFKFSQSGINFIKVESISEQGSFRTNKFAHIDSDCHAAMKRSQLQAGDILFSIAGALGRVAIVSEKALPANINQALSIIRLKRDSGILREFLVYTLKSHTLLEQIERQRGGVAQQNLSLAQVKRFEVQVPSMREQKRIVAILDEAFAGIETAIANTEKNLANARELFESYARWTFSEHGKSWPRNPLSEVCENLDRKRIPITKGKRKSGDVPYYGASGVVDYVADHLFDEDLLLVSEDGANLLARTYPIAFSISGKSWVNNHAHVLRFREITSQKFIEYYLNSISLAPYVSGMAQPKLNQKSLNSIPVPWPSFEVQEEVLTRIDDLRQSRDKLGDTYQRKFASLVELKKSLLQKAFSGELTADRVEEELESATA